MTKNLNKILFLLMVAFSIPFFVNATVVKSLSESTGDITCASTPSSVSENAPVSWSVTGLDAYGPVSYSWSGTGVSGVTTPTATNSAGYSTSGAVSDVSVTLSDLSGPLTIKCGSVTVGKNLSESTGDITCAPTPSSVSENAPVSWSITGLDAYGPVSYSWSGTGVSGVTTPTATNSAGYSTSGAVSDVSLTLSDSSGPLTIKCGSVTVGKNLSESTGDITCAPAPSSVSVNTPVSWSVTGLDAYGPVSYSWSGTGVSGVTTPTATNSAGYSTSGAVSDVSLTLSDSSGPLTIKCGSVTVNATNNGGGGGGGGGGGFYYTINASVGSGGSINNLGLVNFSYGSNQTYTITPNSGYEVSDVLVDGKSVGAITTYTFSDITGSHTISATFSAINNNASPVSANVASNSNTVVTSKVNTAITPNQVQQVTQPTEEPTQQITIPTSQPVQQNTMANNILSSVGAAALLIAGSRWFNYLLMALIILILVYVVYFFIKKRKNKENKP